MVHSIHKRAVQFSNHLAGGSANPSVTARLWMLWTILGVSHGGGGDVGEGDRAEGSTGEPGDVGEAASSSRRWKRRRAGATNVGASADLQAVAAEVAEQVRVLDGLVRYRFGDDAELMGAWASARNVLGPFKPKTEPGTGGNETPRARDASPPGPLSPSLRSGQ